MALSDEDAQRGQRVKAIREARAVTGKEFAAALEAITGDRYDTSEVSRLETGNRVATWRDILAIAALDPEKRGRDWLAWGDDPDAGLQGARTKPTGLSPRGSVGRDPIVERLSEQLSHAGRQGDARRKRRAR
jgi:transcriptional regulator with XRE-family HTH domain